MTAGVLAPRAATRPAPLLAGYRFELTKLLSQWRVRVVLLACWVGPAVFVVAVSAQSALPTDTLFGRQMHASGWAAPLTLLGFSGLWLLPLLTALVAGDVFAAEDRLGTWSSLLVVVRSPRRIFAAKALASSSVLLLLVAGLAVSGTVGGLAAVGDAPLVGLDGQVLTSAEAARSVLLAWVCVLAPTATFAAIGLLGSVALGRSPMGLLLPALVALLLQLVQMLPLPVALRLALPSYAFLSWRGLLTSPAQVGPLLISTCVSLAWAAAATVAARRLFGRRDFTDASYDGSARRLLAGVVPLGVLLAVSFAALSAVAPVGGTGITQDKLQGSLATAYAHLYRVQTRELGRPDVTEAQQDASASCHKGGDQDLDEGPGNDWRCVVTWHLPGVKTVGSAVYQLDVAADGRYVADGDGPKQVNGYFQVQTPQGDAPNPLWQFDGTVDLLAAPT